MKRVVLDTNVTIAAFFWDGYPRGVYNLIRDGKLTMLLSKEMEREFIRVLGYSKFGLSPKEILPFVYDLRKHAEVVVARAGFLQLGLIQQIISSLSALQMEKQTT